MGRHIWWGAALACVVLATILPSYNLKVPLILLGVILFWIGMGRRFLVPAIISVAVIAMAISTMSAISHLPTWGVLKELKSMGGFGSVDASKGRIIEPTKTIPGNYSVINILGEKNIRIVAEPGSSIRISKGIEMISRDRNSIKLKAKPMGDDWPTIVIPGNLDSLTVNGIGIRFEGELRADDVKIHGAGILIDGTILSDTAEISAMGIQVKGGKLGSSLGSISAMGTEISGTMGGTWEIRAMGAELNIKGYLLKSLEIRATGIDGVISYQRCEGSPRLSISALGSSLKVIHPRECHIQLSKQGIGVDVEVVERD